MKDNTISIDHSEGELPVDGLLDEQTRTEDSQHEMWLSVKEIVLRWREPYHNGLEAHLAERFTITRKQV